MITAYPFGTLPDGTPVTRYRLQNSENAYVDILDYGATIQALVMPDKYGMPTDVVLGYDTLSGYARGTLYFGATVGRHCGRIGGGSFTLSGKTYTLDKNSGPNHIHGGVSGFHQRMFAAEILPNNCLCLHLTSPDGDQGYPGNLEVSVRFTLFPNNTLVIRYGGVSDRDTLLNLTNHSYFDLSGGQDPMGQRLYLDAETYAENDENTLPTGRLLPVAGTAFDFNKGKLLRRDLEAEDAQLRLCRGYDHSFLLRRTGALREFARLSSPLTGIVMQVATDLPAVQVYTANFVEEKQGKGGRHYKPHSAVCLETQFLPNAIHIPGAEAPVLRTGAEYDHSTAFVFSTEEG